MDLIVNNVKPENVSVLVVDFATKKLIVNSKILFVTIVSMESVNVLDVVPDVDDLLIVLKETRLVPFVLMEFVEEIVEVHVP